MKVIVITSICALATAVMGYGVPDCAGNCINNYGGCNPYDYKCICSDTTFIDNLACCVSKSCSQKDQKLTIEFAQKFCKPYGITNIPSAATCASTATSTSTATTSATGASTITTTTSVMSGAVMKTVTSQTNTPSSMTASFRSPSTSPSATTTQGSGAGIKQSVEKFGLGMVVAGLVAVL